MPVPNTEMMVDGSINFSGGIDSVKVTTIASESNPTGLRRDQLAWSNNAQVRGGGISPRGGWHPVAEVHDGSAFYQGGFLYQPRNAFPFWVHSIGGRIYSVDPQTGTVTDLSAIFGLTNPPDIPYAFFEQGEEFLVIQAGDYATLPLFFWQNTDGTQGMRRSIGITTATPTQAPGQNEIPAAGAMDYYMGRLWYEQGTQYSAGDIVGGPSGTGAFARRDAILNVTESPLVFGGDGFKLPINAGNIRAIEHGASIDTTQGEGRLFIFTAKAIFSLQVPVTRNDWIATTSDNQPLQTVVQLVNGSVNDRSVVAINGDLFFQSLEPGIRSLIQAIRQFSMWGNKSISANVQRVLQFNDRALLRYSSGIEFNNRLLQTALPRETPQGIVHDALIPLDFIPVSSFGEEHPPVWDGMYEGLPHFQLFSGNFGGRERAFSIARGQNGSIQLWELTGDSRTENGDNRIAWGFETPAYTWGNELMLKKLHTLDLWVDKLWGTAYFKVEWRPDSEPCWQYWAEFKLCSPRNSSEDANNPIPYPEVQFGDSYRSTVTLPRPPVKCAAATGRTADIGYQMQVRLTIIGYCRIRGIFLHAEGRGRVLHDNMIKCETPSL